MNDSEWMARNDLRKAQDRLALASRLAELVDDFYSPAKYLSDREQEILDAARAFKASPSGKR